MIKLRTIGRQAVLAAVFLMTVLASGAVNTDAEGYPVMYLRGQQISSPWSADDHYRFTRSGEVYTIHVDRLDGEFKISDSDWQLNYGSDPSGKQTISGDCTVTGYQNGPNFIARDLRDLTVSFTLNRNGSTTIHFTTSTVRPPVEGLSGTLPVLYIDVRNADGTYNDEIISKDLAHKDYFDAEYRLDLNGCKWLEELGAKSVGTADAPLKAQIKARGNWTRKGFSKKPFKLKLADKQALLGLSKSKHFALLAHADDNRGYLRNFTGFNLGRRIGLPWTPWQQPVEVVINGDYRGLYFLTESIRIEKDRVNITELDDNVSDAALISGGYLVELDNYDEDNQLRFTEKSCVSGHSLDALRVTFDTPEEYSELQRRFVGDQFEAINNAVGVCDDALWSYLDLDDAARYYLVNEIIGHVEAYHGSTYLFRDRGEGQKWHFSPLWDCGNAFVAPAEGYFYDHDPFGNTWIPSMRQNARFNAKIEATWEWFMSACYDGLTDDIKAYCDHIAAAAVADRRRWKDRPVPDGGQPVADNSDITGRRDEVISYLAKRIAWLTNRFGKFDTANPAAEPERDTTPAAALPAYAGIENVIIDADNNTPVRYYNLSGIEIPGPDTRGYYIERRAGRSFLRPPKRD